MLLLGWVSSQTGGLVGNKERFIIFLTDSTLTTDTECVRLSLP